MVRHIRKITLLVLLSLTISPSPAQGMSYASGLWNGATRLSTLCVDGWNTAKNLVPSISGVGSMLGKIPGFQSVARGASSAFGGASTAISQYYNMESSRSMRGARINPLITLLPLAVYTFRGPMCSWLSRMTRDNLSPRFFNKVLTATTTPITLAIHICCLYHAIADTSPFLAPALVLEIINYLSLIINEMTALRLINELQTPPLPPHWLYTSIISYALAISRPSDGAYGFLQEANHITIYLSQLFYYRDMGISARVKETLQDMTAKLNRIIRQLNRYFSPPVRHNLTIDSLADNKTCAICREDFVAGEKGTRLACNHHYHTDCIDEWLERHATCPLCRAAAQPNTLTYVNFT